MSAVHVVYVPQAGDAGDEDGRRIGAWKGNPPAQVASVSWWKAYSSTASVEFYVHVFRRRPNQYENRAPDISKTKSNAKRHRGDPTLSQAAVFPVQNKVRCKRHLQSALRCTD